VTVPGLGSSSIQGDVGFVDVLEQMGCTAQRDPDVVTIQGPPPSRLSAVDIDLSDMPDMVPTLAVLALFADGRTTIRNVAHLRLKESDRLEALGRELARLGAAVEAREDGLAIDPPETIRPATVHTYDDHRMAMSFALCGLAVDGVRIENPLCCEKSLPDFFDRWDEMLEKKKGSG